MEKPEPLPNNIDPDSFVGVTEYRYRDLPNWAKQQLQPPPSNQKQKNQILYI